MTHMTVAREAHADLEAKGSRFHAFLMPIAEFDRRLAELREVHRKASHHVTAWRRMSESEQIEEHANDDGEPAGTSGMPALRVLIGAGLVEAGVIVVRYFGGTKLGTGGLARAYSGATALALAEARLVPWQRLIRRSLRCGFADSGELERRVAAAGLTVIAREFHEGGLSLTVEGAEEDIAAAALPDWR